MPQALHAVEPDASWNSPATHIAQTASPTLDANVPGAHSACAVDPVAQADPSGHAEHSLELVRFATFEYEPAGHGSSADAPSGQKLPPLHTLHATMPS